VPASTNPPAHGTIAFARDLQQTWKELFARAGLEFRPATIVARSARSDCASSVKGNAFYCYSDSKLLLYPRLANAYLIDHAYAHHVQELVHITDQIARAVKASPRQGGDLWRRHELQADCLAGVSVHSRYRPDEAAAMVERAVLPAVADQFLESKAWNGAPRRQRVVWFVKGLRDGKASACDTFSRDV
jgi:predicted metalloprotease